MKEETKFYINVGIGIFATLGILYLLICLACSYGNDTKIYDVYVNVSGTERYYEATYVWQKTVTTELTVKGKKVIVPKSATIVELNRVVTPYIPKIFNIFGQYKEGENK